MAAPALDFDPKRLEGYLKARLPELEGEIAVVRIGGGQSNPTYRLKFASSAVILRKQPAGELLPSRTRSIASSGCSARSLRPTSRCRECCTCARTVR